MAFTTTNNLPRDLEPLTSHTVDNSAFGVTSDEMVGGALLHQATLGNLRAYCRDQTEGEVVASVRAVEELQFQLQLDLVLPEGYSSIAEVASRLGVDDEIVRGLASTKENKQSFFIPAVVSAKGDYYFRDEDISRLEQQGDLRENFEAAVNYLCKVDYDHHSDTYVAPNGVVYERPQFAK